MNSQIKAVIFDFDGLLIDSEPTWHKAYEIFLKNHQVNDNPDVYEKMIGRGLKENIKIARDELGVKGEISELLSELRTIFYNLLRRKDNLLMPGAFDLLEGLGFYKLAVTTGGHTRDKCSQIFKDIGIEMYFDVVVSSDDVKSGKPAPDVYLETVRQLEVKSADCLVLEDAVNGVVAAKAAGMWVLGVNANEKVRAELEKVGADGVYSSLKEIDINGIRLNSV